MDWFRIERSSQDTIGHTFLVGETPTPATGDVTVTLRRLDGTQVHQSTAVAAGDGYTYTPPPQADLDVLTLDWSGTVAGLARVERDIVEIVGGFYFDLKTARDSHPTLSNTSTYPTATLKQKRVRVEQEAEAITGQAWVPRFARFLLDGTGTNELVVPDMALRAVRAASIATHAGASFDALTGGQLAAIAAQPEGVLIRDDGGTWPYGHRNVIVEYEHGADAPPGDIIDAAILRIRSRMSVTRSGIPDRALSFTVADGGTYRLSLPGKRTTGVPEVDGAYSRHGPGERVWLAG